MNLNFFFHSSVDGHLGCFHVLAIVNSAAVSIGVHVLLFFFHFWIPQGMCLGVGLLGHQFSSVAQLCPTLCDPMNGSMSGLPVHQQLPEFTQTHVH